MSLRPQLVGVLLIMLLLLVIETGGMIYCILYFDLFNKHEIYEFLTLIFAYVVLTTTNLLVIVGALQKRGSLFKPWLYIHLCGAVTGYTGANVLFYYFLMVLFDNYLVHCSLIVALVSIVLLIGWSVVETLYQNISGAKKDLGF